MDALVSTAWLADHLGERDLRVIDATYHANFPGEPPRDARAEYLAGHVAGAVFLDLGSLRDTASDLPNMLPSAEQVASRLRRLGVGDGQRIVLYDNSPHRTAARAWWVLRHYGVAASILDGGLATWRSESRALVTDDEKAREGHLTLGERRADVWSKDDMLANVDTAATQILDARSPARFTGAEGDPRAGTAAGHIPGSVNLPYSRLFDVDGKWKRGEALAAAFNEAGIDLDRPIVTTCGSGVTAAVLGFGLHLLGHEFALYDGSWSEWGSDPALPKVITA